MIYQSRYIYIEQVRYFNFRDRHSNKDTGVTEISFQLKSRQNYRLSESENYILQTVGRRTRTEDIFDVRPMRSGISHRVPDNKKSSIGRNLGQEECIQTYRWSTTTKQVPSNNTWSLTQTYTWLRLNLLVIHNDRTSPINNNRCLNQTCPTDDQQ